MKKKRQPKRVGRQPTLAAEVVQPIGLVAGGNSLGLANVQELVGLYIAVILLFVAFSFWFSFGMFS